MTSGVGEGRAREVCSGRGGGFFLRVEFGGWRRVLKERGTAGVKPCLLRRAGGKGEVCARWSARVVMVVWVDGLSPLRMANVWYRCCSRRFRWMRLQRAFLWVYLARSSGVSVLKVFLDERLRGEALVFLFSASFTVK